MKTSRIALLLLPLLMLAFAVPAWAEDEEGATNDLKARIQKKMAGILELMKQNEAALLKLSTGKNAATKKVDVEVPDPQAAGSSSDGTSGGSSSGGSSSGGEGTSGASGTKGGEIGKKLDELIRGQRKAGGAIPDELKELVEMIPL